MLRYARARTHKAHLKARVYASHFHAQLRYATLGRAMATRDFVLVNLISARMRM